MCGRKYRILMILQYSNETLNDEEQRKVLRDMKKNNKIVRIEIINSKIFVILRTFLIYLQA